jgi:uncharacterized protein (TIGR02246 family)
VEEGGVSTSTLAADATRLYFALLAAWNRQDASAMAALFAEDGSLVGFDGSAIDSRAAIAAHLAPIFAQHPTPLFVGVVRETRVLADDAVLMVRAVAGMWPRGAADLQPDLNAVQTMVAARVTGDWRVQMFQNTPAAWHGREKEREALSAELRALGRPEAA